MSTDLSDAFLQAIRESPDDDTPRLVYADWLEERGDPRGEFIRVQCERARLPEHHPRRVVLQYQEQALLDRHGAGWRAALPKFPGVTWGEFERGFVASVRVADFVALTRHYGEIGRAAPVTAAAVRTAHYDDNLRRLPALPNLRSLAARELNDRVGELCDAAILSTLTALDLTGNSLDNPGLFRLTRSFYLANLRRLTLDDNAIGQYGMDSLAGAERLANLTHLSLRGNGGGGYSDDPTIGAEGVRILAGSPYLSNLTSLDLGNNEIGSEVVAPLLESRYLTKLTHLSLANNRLNEHGMEAFAQARGKVRLRSLDVGDNRLGDRGMAALASSSVLDDLERLDAALCQVGDSGVRRLCRMPLVKALCVLNLDGNDVGADGAAALAEAGAKFKNLHTLSLANNEIDPGRAAGAGAAQQPADRRGRVRAGRGEPAAARVAESDGRRRGQRRAGGAGRGGRLRQPVAAAPRAQPGRAGGSAGAGEVAAGGAAGPAAPGRQPARQRRRQGAGERENDDAARGADADAQPDDGRGDGAASAGPRPRVAEPGFVGGAGQPALRGDAAAAGAALQRRVVEGEPGA